MLTIADQPLTKDEKKELVAFLRNAVGRYSVGRASQLSGVPERTIYDWARAGVLIPDFYNRRPNQWSYRDLVYLRLVAWLRAKKMPRPQVVERILTLRKRLHEGEEIQLVRGTPHALILADEEEDILSGQKSLPNLIHFVDEFELIIPGDVKEITKAKLWGPHLMRPTTRTVIDPNVMAGDPCVRDTRIPTSTLFALHTIRQLESEAIRRLYPNLEPGDVGEAIDLERRLRRTSLAA